MSITIPVFDYSDIHEACKQNRFLIRFGNQPSRNVRDYLKSMACNAGRYISVKTVNSELCWVELR